MTHKRSHVLAEIRRLADANRGKPPGRRLFERETGLKESDWYPTLWLRWGDAVEEAGFSRNIKQAAVSEYGLLELYARLAQKLSRLPLQGAVMRESKTNPEFPSEKTYRRLGGRAKLLERLAQFCRQHTGFEE